MGIVYSTCGDIYSNHSDIHDTCKSAAKCIKDYGTSAMVTAPHCMDISSLYKLQALTTVISGLENSHTTRAAWYRQEHPFCKAPQAPVYPSHCAAIMQALAACPGY